MNELSEQQIVFLTSCGIEQPTRVKQLFAGRNSKVLKLSNSTGRWILKDYPPTTHSQNRLVTEFKFLSYLHQNNLGDFTPKPIGLDENLNQAVYSYIDGCRPKNITSNHVEQAAQFVAYINQSSGKNDVTVLPLSVDACLSWQEHLDLADSRLQRLKQLQPISKLEHEMQAFVTDQLMPIWSNLKNKILAAMTSKQLGEKLDISRQIISPSDFGFHNTLDHYAKLYFLDFEYAGRDDPVKLICDFICQPELPITSEQADAFILTITTLMTKHEVISSKVRQLLPVHRLKWCCILLNEFRREDRERRGHAGVDLDGLLSKQLLKAQAYFDIHLSTLA